MSRADLQDVTRRLGAFTLEPRRHKTLPYAASPDYVKFQAVVKWPRLDHGFPVSDEGSPQATLTGAQDQYLNQWAYITYQNINTAGEPMKMWVLVLTDTSIRSIRNTLIR